MNDIDKRVKNSEGYQLIVENLERYFGQDNYRIVSYQYTGESEDNTNNDFNIKVDFKRLKSIRFFVDGSGYRRPQRVGGTGSFGIVFPSKELMGTEFSVVLGTKEFQFGASVMNKTRAQSYFEQFKKYYDNLSEEDQKKNEKYK